LKITRIAILFFVFSSSAWAAVTISPDHPELLQQGIQDAYAAGQSSVVIPAGVYLIPALAPNWTHLDLSNMSDFDIDATGATFVFQDNSARGMQFVNCLNVSFHGATMYFATPPFSQGVVQAIASDLTSIDVQIEKGYPTNLDDTRYFSAQIIGHLFDRTTRWWKRGVYGDVYGKTTQRLGPDTFRISASTLGGAEVGDLIGFRDGTGDHAIRVIASSRMYLHDLTILNSPNFGITESLGGDAGQNHYAAITIKRGNRPAGATTDPLFSTTADGFHSTGARLGPLVENCSFESMPDDGIAVHGTYSFVIEGAGNTLIVSNTRVEGDVNFSVGDPLRLIDADDRFVGDAVVTGIVPLPNYRNSRKSARASAWDTTVGPYYQITLDRSLSAGFDYLAGNPAASGAGFILRNNTIMNHRERGIYLQADNGLVEQNLIDGSTVGGITVGPDFYFHEAGYSHNLTIRNNTIRNVGYWGYQTAALTFAPDQGAMAVAGGFQNIVIDSNTFEDFDIPAIFLSSVSGATITNNTFRNLLEAAPFGVWNRGEAVPSGTVVFVTQAENVDFSGNTLSQPGPRTTEFVHPSTSATALTGDIVTALTLNIDGGVASGRLTNGQGNGIGGQPVKVTLQPIAGDGVVAAYTLTGTVPASINKAIVQICVNLCDSSVAPNNMSVYSFQYTDSGTATSLDFSKGLSGWGVDGDGSAQVQTGSDATGSFVQTTATSAQSTFVNSSTFPVTPGAPYTLTARARISPSSVGSGYFALIFLVNQEVSRDKLFYEPATIVSGPVQTASDGTYGAPLALQYPGIYKVTASYAGSLTYAGGLMSSTASMQGDLIPRCDINADGDTNVADVQTIINEALGVVASTHDLNSDGIVNVADVQIGINAALGLGCNAL